MKGSSLQLVEVVLATYNGELYLGELLDSLLAQSYGGWRLEARDDGSSDRTVALLESFQQKHPTRIIIIKDNDGNLGPRDNFSRIANSTSSGYLMFADQDDIWRPEKIEITLDQMRAVELVKGVDFPILVHTDMRVVDVTGKVIGESFWDYQNLKATACMKLPRQLVQNYVTGCTMMINRKLLELSMPVPPDAIMHDWWFALVASAFGEIAVVKRQTVNYRQHGENSIGAKRWGSRHVAAELLGGIGELRKRIRATRSQARSFLERYEQRLGPELTRVVSEYVTLERYGYFRRRVVGIRNGFFKSGLIRNIGYYVAL